MVRKVRNAMLACLIVCALCAPMASAASVYDGNISTTQLAYFRDAVSSVSINDHYVMYRSGEYEYKMVFGDIECYGSQFVDGGGTLQEITLTWTSGNYGQSTYYTWTQNDISSFVLDAGNHIVYSDLGHYPQLEGRDTQYAFIQMFVLCTCALALVIGRVFGGLVRTRR